MAKAAPIDPADLTIAPLTPDRWHDFVDLFGPSRGALGGCWCQWFRMQRPDYQALDRDGRRARMAGLVENGPPPGVLAYWDGLPVGWCAVAPRADQPRLDRGRASKRRAGEDYNAVWVITCFFVDSAHRRRGLMRPLIEGAVRLAADQGARRVEAYPMIPNQRSGNGDVYVGHRDTFLSCGFRQVAQPLPQRVVVRRTL